MNIKDGIGWNGQLSFGVVDEAVIKEIGIKNFLKGIADGSLQWKREYKQHNKVTDYARNYIAQMITMSVYVPWILPNQIELGTGVGTPASSDVDLFTPASATLKSCSNIQVYLNFFAQYISVWQTTDPIVGTWAEAGLKDTNNNLWAHAAFNLVVNTGEMLVAQWQVQIVGN